MYRPASRRLLPSVFIALASFSWLVSFTRGHPLCLDFEPPFRPYGGLDFCREYSDLSCCTRADDLRIRTRYEIYVSSRPNSSNTCSDRLKTILCLECSPSAVHIYDAETTMVKKPFPGLCRSYCGDTYRMCRDIVAFVTNASSVLDPLRTSEDSFCNAIAITDRKYCYPDILNDPEFNPNFTRNYSTAEGCLCMKRFATSLRNPLLLLSPDDDSGRIFVGEQLGLVSIYYKNGTRRNELFLDISSLVLHSPSPGDERGFLSLTFHPNFKVNQKLYVYYAIGRNGNFRTRLSELTTSASNRDKVNINTERVLLDIDQPFSNHNGGQLLFGIDGYLYLTTGDGGSGGDPYNNAQNLSTLLGKVLRIDVDRQRNGSGYGIPPTNPFLTSSGARPEIYAYGCRNMWRCSMDSGDPKTGQGRGRIFCGDVGQSKWEEVDIIKSGANYGWSSREGFECYNYMCGRIGPEEYPIYAYNHSVGNCIIGGYVYRGCTYPNLQGFYIYADYGYGKLFRLKEISSNQWENKEIKMCGRDVCFNGLTPDFENNILSLGVDFEDELYVLTTSYPGSESYSGSIYTLVDPKRRADPTECISNRQTSPTSVTTTTTYSPLSSPSKSSSIPTTTNPTSLSSSSSSSASSSSSTTSRTTTISTRTTTRGMLVIDETTLKPSPPSVSWNWSCDFELASDSPSWCGIVQATDDNFDWTIYDRPTPSDPTGPDQAYSGRWYIYIETSNPRLPNDTAKIYLPSPTSPGIYCIAFHYHMFGFHIRELQLFRETTSNKQPETIWRSTKQKGNFWLFAQLPISIDRGQKIGFIGVRGDEYSGDIGLDDLALRSGNCP